MGGGLGLDFTRTTTTNANQQLSIPHGSVLILLDPVGGDQVNHEVSPSDFWYNSVPLAIHICQTNTFRKYHSRIG